jgi:4-amino-4-deoxy-L-arabinose transferase-like glycosyltransferase
MNEEATNLHSQPKANGRPWWAAIAAITLLGFATRLIGLRDSPAGDELIFHWYVNDRSFSSMWSLVVNHEKTPPLGFILGWLTAHIGSPATWMRLPALLAGTATIPLVGLLARRCATPLTGLVAAALVATSPFLMFYGIEARAYGLAACLSCASVLLLLTASDHGGKRRWAAWALVTSLALLSHYTAVFVILASVAWALVSQRRLLKPLLLSGVGVLLLVSWWIPSFVTQWGHSGSEARRIGNLAPLALSTLGNITTRALVGHPLWSSLQTTPTSTIPGTPALVMIISGLAIALIVGLVTWLRSDRRSLRPKSETVLLAMCAVATPVGLVLLSLEPGKTLLLPRNLICSLPATAALVAVPVAKLKRQLALLSTLLIAGGLLIGSVLELTDYGRPNMRAAANAIESRWAPGDSILEAIYFNEPPLDQDLSIHLGAAQRAQLELSSKVGLRPFDAPQPVGTSIFTVAPIYGYTIEALGPRPEQAKGWKLVWQHKWPGLPPVVAAQWRKTAAGR